MNKIKTNFEGQNIYVGMDVHKASWNLGIHLNDMFIRNVHQKPNPHIIAGYFYRGICNSFSCFVHWDTRPTI